MKISFPWDLISWPDRTVSPPVVPCETIEEAGYDVDAVQRSLEQVDRGEFVTLAELRIAALERGWFLPKEVEP